MEGLITTYFKCDLIYLVVRLILGEIDAMGFMPPSYKTTGYLLGYLPLGIMDIMVWTHWGMLNSIINFLVGSGS